VTVAINKETPTKYAPLCIRLVCWGTMVKRLIILQHITSECVLLKRAYNSPGYAYLLACGQTMGRRTACSQKKTTSITPQPIRSIFTLIPTRVIYTKSTMKLNYKTTYQQRAW